jgi:hypothetical protein
MSKLRRGRLSGVDGMQTFTSGELFAFAERRERQMQDPQNQDDPRWRSRRVEDVRRFAAMKEKAKEYKERQS